MKPAKLLIAAVIAAIAACGAPKPPPTAAELASLAAKGDASAAAGLIGKMGIQNSQEDRSIAYRALLALGSGAGKEILAATKNADPAIREHALALSANLKLPGAFEAAGEALSDTSFTRVHAAAWALGELGDERAIPLLADAMVRFKAGFKAREAGRALARYGGKAAGVMADRYPSMDPEVKSYVIRILAEMKTPEAGPVILGALEDPKYRADAVWAVGVMGKGTMAVDLIPYLSDPDPLVRIEACRAAGVLEYREAEKTLMRMRSEDPDIVVREWAARGLGLIRGAPEKYLTKDRSWKEPDSLYH